MTAKSGEGNRPGSLKSDAGQRPGYVRLIGGAWRGRRLRVPRGAVLRPTPDRVRETLFNWLAPEIEGAVCLDLFAGIGSLGFEALSRGAEQAWLVERDPKLARALEEHAAALGASGSASARAASTPGSVPGSARGRAAGSPPPAARAHVVRASALEFLRRASETRFDVVFLDPPFADPIEPVLEALVPRLRHRALVYVERPARAGLPEAREAVWIKTARAGAVVYGLLRFGAEET
jgi:16S rRNA (guanine966-N2)-methyltransferase